MLKLSPGVGVGGGYSWEFVVGMCRPVLQILTLFQTKKLSFSTHVFRPGVGRNYVIITKIRTPTKRFLKIYLEFAYCSFFLINLELKRRGRLLEVVVNEVPTIVI